MLLMLMPTMSMSFSETSAVTVLVVDDENFIRSIVAEALEIEGYFTVQAENACAALDLLHTDPVVDILITDMHLPDDFNGHQLALKARNLRPALKVIFMTGDPVAASKISQQPDLVDGVLVKPFCLDALWQVVESCLKVP
jgi:DNA-binding NtrC family response regulator